MIISEEITITNAANGGFGITKINGKTVFVDFAVPGDRLLIDIYREAKNYSFAVISRIIEPSPLRIKPECPNFGLCGGCAYLNVNYDTELEFKKQILRDLLERITGLETEDIPAIEIINGQRFGYRSHAGIKVSGDKKGFYTRNTNKLVQFPEDGCRLLCETLNNGIGSLTAGKDDEEIKTASDCMSTFINSIDTPDAEVIEAVSGLKFRHDLRGFFQANMISREAMIKRVLEYVSPSKNEVFIDICCGCGFFSLPLALSSCKGFGFDSDRRSIQNAVYNMKLNNISNIKFEALAESEIHPFRHRPDYIVIDPPRSGISKNGRKTINAMRPSRMVYVSCEPSTFARDTADFIKGGLLLDRLTMIDMFPCTKHIEVISRFSAVTGDYKV